MSTRLGKELHRIRTFHGLSLRQVEKITGISNAYLSQLENGKAGNPSPHILLQLSEVYGVPYESLMETAGHLYAENPEQLHRRISGIQAALMSTPLEDDEQEKVTEFIEFLRSQRNKKSPASTISRTPVIALARRPESEPEISKIVDRLLRKTDALGKLPTPIDDLVSSVKVDDFNDAESFRDQFISTLPERAKEIFHAAWQKIRGIADLRERAIYVAKEQTAPRAFFAKAHELGHQLIPWQKVNRIYSDDNLTLSSDAEILFDIEANHFAAEVIFQGERFMRRVRDYKPSFDAIFKLAQEHGASRHATLRRYVEEHDEAIAAIPYWPSDYAVDKEGFPVLRAGKLLGSPSFIKKYAAIQLPLEISSGNEWVAARNDSDAFCTGDIKLDCGAGAVKFEWQSWWNKYSLLILLRRRPALSAIGNLTA